jgi:hypothetical protein
MIKSLLKTVMVVGLIVLAARVRVPHALHLIVGTRCRELYLLSVIALGLGTQVHREGHLLLRRGALPELAHPLRAGTLADVQVDTCRVEANSHVLRKSLSQLGIHGRTGASVMALTRNVATQSNPSHNTVLESGDVLVLLGARDQIRKAIAFLVYTKILET